MSAIGPSLPPHLLAKRKRQQEQGEDDRSSTKPGAKRSPSSEDAEKRRRVMGPAMPPAPLDEKPTKPAEQQEEDSEDSDDDFGPALPRKDETTNDAAGSKSGNESGPDDLTRRPAEEKLQRDDWMMMPPKQDDLAARLDPNKPRPRAFNSGKGARGGGEGDAADGGGSTWHETAEQKRQRLADEMMGITRKSSSGPITKSKTSRDNGAKQSGRVDENISKGPSLLEQHQRSKGSEVEDDPSKRAFDREKDMGSGMRISSTQRKDLLNKAADYGSKFSRGGLL